MKYSIPAELAEILDDSTGFAKLELEVLKSFTSKYALTLYEALAWRVRMSHVFSERMSLDDFRDPNATAQSGNTFFAAKPRRIPDMKGYKFTAENLALLLQAAMKDVSPSR